MEGELDFEDFKAVAIVLPIAGAIVGYWIRYYLDRKKELVSEVNRERRAAYQQLVDVLFGILESSKKEGGQSVKELQKSVDDLYKVCRKEVLYASPEVINAFANMMNYSRQNPQNNPAKLMLLFGHLLAAMRKDLGLSNKNLGKDYRRLLSAVISDIDHLK